MGILKDIGSIATTVGEARRATDFVTKLLNGKNKTKTLEQELEAERQRRQALEAAIREHKMTMQQESLPRTFPCDQRLWSILDIVTTVSQPEVKPKTPRRK